MTLKELNKKCSRSGIISIIVARYGQKKGGGNYSNHDIKNVIRLHGEDTFNFLDHNALFELMSKVNKEVKHESCPNNLRNRFYDRKTRVIKWALRNGMVDEIFESDGLYRFTIAGHSFHQLKLCFPNGINGMTVGGFEEYVPEPRNVEFSLEAYNECMVNMTYAIIKHY